ncbi:MAG: hypothetical protein ACE5DN_00645 [Flavobacteriales bacterium]
MKEQQDFDYKAFEQQALEISNITAAASIESAPPYRNFHNFVQRCTNLNACLCKNIIPLFQNLCVGAVGKLAAAFLFNGQSGIFKTGSFG